MVTIHASGGSLCPLFLYTIGDSQEHMLHQPLHNKHLVDNKGICYIHHFQCKGVKSKTPDS